MAAVQVTELGRAREPRDGSRRYLPVAMTFDTRALMLDSPPDGPEVEPQVSEQNRQNQARLREGLIHEFGGANYQQKISNFADLGAAPWSVVALHNIYLDEVREAFTHGAYYPALVGACALGERILNQLVLTLRDDYVEHPATKHVAGKKAIAAWDKCIRTLEAWGILTPELKHQCESLRDARHAAVHYNTDLDSGDARAAALAAIAHLDSIVEGLFHPHRSGPHYVNGPIGRSYVRLGAESDPFIRRFVLPACALVSPRFRFVPAAHGFDIYDDPDYGVTDPPLSDEEFADPARAHPQVEYPF